jgi:hypothetical protein
MEVMRHVAKVANTDQRCVVVFMQIPGKEDHSLVIPVDGLHPRIEQAIMQVLKSPEGQQAEAFVEVLHRHRMPDTGDTILAALHKTGKLVRVPINNVIMLPQPNHPVPLTKILEDLGRMPQRLNYELDKFNPHTNNQQAATSENTRSIARGLIMEAEMLESDARKKRDQAYQYDSSLRPSGNAVTPPSSISILDAPYNPLEIKDDYFVSNGAAPVTEAQVIEDKFDKRLAALEELINKIVRLPADEPAEETE